VSLVVEAAASAPPGWDAWLDTVGGAGYAASAWWTAAAARHFPAANALWLLAYHEGRLAGGLAAVSRRRWLLGRFESSVEGSPAGPVLDPTFAPDLRDAAFDALVGAYAARVGGRTVSAVLTLDHADEIAHGARLARSSRWRRAEVPTALVDIGGGLAHVEAHVLSNNRRNERNRGLKRGCSLHTSSDLADLAAWYPLYREVAQDWAQAPVPLAFMQDLARTRPDRAFLVHVRHAGAIIGGHFCLHWRDRVYALYGASRRDVARELFPATLLYWQDIVESCRRGVAGLDFGGFGGQAGLRRFKQLMGAREEMRAQYTCDRRGWQLLTAARHRWRGRP
jgi:hypothetical protein